MSGDSVIGKTSYTRFFKPLLDRVLAMLLLVPLSPILLVLALLIKCTSRGPVFFKQRRIGRHRSEFEIYKFRSMYVDPPKDTPTHLLTNATSHITPVGRFLRKSSLDELPQIFNILNGTMSFIGPRPALWNQYDLADERDRWGANDVTPGITGWAQVTGRDELPIPVKAERDGYYAGHISFTLDIRILFLTCFNVLVAKGVREGAAGDEKK